MVVCGGAMCTCSFGVAPSALMITPENKVTTTMPIATIMDYIPLKNILSFGMCQSMANPTVASATAAKLGVFTPMPCIPMTNAPWIPGCPTVLIGNKPALNQSSKLMCSYGGIIQITNPGTTGISVP